MEDIEPRTVSELLGWELTIDCMLTDDERLSLAYDAWRAFGEFGYIGGVVLIRS